MEQTFAGKVVLVTGANSGIGEATALAFAAAGASVYAVARRAQALHEARARHAHIHWLQGDVSQGPEIRALVESVVREAGRLDVVVNNAGVFQLAPLEQATDEQIRSQFEINVYGPSFVTQAALPALKQSRGTVVNIGSAAGHKAAAGASHYAATKAALESLTRSWALELAPHGVRVNVIAPGPTETPVFGKAVPAAAVNDVKAAFTAQVPLGRIAHVDEIARWVVQIADPSVTWVTGQVLSIDGGMSLT